MDGLILILIFAGVGYYLYKKRKERVAEIKFEISQRNRYFSRPKRGHIPMDSINAVNQILETTSIMVDSKNIDTIEGRADFLKERIETVKWASMEGNYQDILQRGLDRYKTTYYDKDIHKWQINILSDPYGFDFDWFYANCIWNGFNKYYESQLKEIRNLKMNHAIKKRYHNIADKLTEVKRILNKLNGSSETIKYVNSLESEIKVLDQEIKSHIDGHE